MILPPAPHEWQERKANYEKKKKKKKKKREEEEMKCNIMKNASEKLKWKRSMWWDTKNELKIIKKKWTEYKREVEMKCMTTQD